MIRKNFVSFLILAFFLLSSCNTVKGVTTGVGRDVKAVWHYGSCAWDWDKDCQKK